MGWPGRRPFRGPLQSAGQARLPPVGGRPWRHDGAEEAGVREGVDQLACTDKAEEARVHEGFYQPGRKGRAAREVVELRVGPAEPQRSARFVKRAGFLPLLT